MSGLLTGWSTLTLADAVVDDAPIIYGILQPGPDVAGGIPYVRPTEIRNGRIALEELRRTTIEIAERYRRSTLAADDLILSIVGTIGKVAVVPADLSGGNITQSSCRIRPEQRICERGWMRYFLVSPLAGKHYEENRLGTAVPRLNLEDVRQFEMPLPPLAEQKRIVTKLDALSAKTARARTDLSRIETLVARYKQAVLSKAFSEVVPRKAVGELVARIKAGKNLRCEERPPHLHEKGVVKVSAVTWGEFRADQSKTLPPDFRPDEDTRIRPGDFLFSRANTIELVGAVVIVEDTPDNLYLSDKILRLEFREPLEVWLLWYLRSPEGREALMNISSGNQLSMRNIGQKSLLSLSVPYANPTSRDEIVRRIESAFAKIDRLAIEAKRALKLLGKLDGAILAKAFRGELVPQDEADEPAEKLLERIRAERDGTPKARRRTPGASSRLDNKRKTTEMTKTRGDVEKDHLAQILRDKGGTNSPTDLWLQSGMEIDEFYKQLRTEIDSGQIREGAGKVKLLLLHAHGQPEDQLLQELD